MTPAEMERVRVLLLRGVRLPGELADALLEEIDAALAEARAPFAGGREETPHQARRRLYAELGRQLPGSAHRRAVLIEHLVAAVEAGELEPGEVSLRFALFCRSFFALGLPALSARTIRRLISDE